MTDPRIDVVILARLQAGDRVRAHRSKLVYELTERTDLLGGGWRARLVEGDGSNLITDSELLDRWELVAAVPAGGPTDLPDVLRSKAPARPAPGWRYGPTDLLTAAAAAIDRHRADDGDLRWLVGHLAAYAVEGVGLPARLAPLVAACREDYDPARFTLVYVAGATGSDTPDPRDKPGLVGREDKLNETLAGLLHQAALARYDHTPVRDMHRGRWFELRGEDGHVWRVAVTLDRMETDDAD